MPKCSKANTHTNMKQNNWNHNICECLIDTHVKGHNKIDLRDIKSISKTAVGSHKLYCAIVDFSENN